MIRRIVIATLVLLAGCTATVAPPTAPREFPQALSPASKADFKYLAVSDIGTNTLDVFDSSLNRVETIVRAIDGPLGNAFDRQGNLYVANWKSHDVAEYDPKGNLLFIYSHGLVNPLGVTVDRDGNVFVADNGRGKPSYVFEYRQLKDKTIASCFTGLLNVGIAVRGDGDVFVAGGSSNRGGGYLRIYRGGLAGCHAQIPQIVFGGTGGMRFDRQGNMLLCDQLVGVDVLPPPFDTIKSTIKLTADSYDVALTKKNDAMFVSNADYPYSLVVEATYPDGKPIRVLSTQFGIEVPTGVSTFP